VHAKKAEDGDHRPLVVLRVARSGTLLCKRPSGLTGGSQPPGLPDRETFFHVFKHWQCLCRRSIQRFDARSRRSTIWHHHEDPSMRIVEGEAAKPRCQREGPLNVSAVVLQRSSSLSVLRECFIE
jgi:hypothetical protein